MKLVNLFLAFVPIWSLIYAAPTINHIDKERQQIIKECTEYPTNDFAPINYKLSCGGQR